MSLPRIARSLAVGACVCTAGFLQTGANAQSTMIDDSAPGWMWTLGSMVTDPAFHGGTAHAIPPGGEGTYAFHGNGFQVFTMTGPTVTVKDQAHRLGKLDVYVDGVLQKECPQAKPSISFDYLTYQTGGLGNGTHVLELKAEGGWVVVDYIDVGVVDSAAPPVDNVPAGFTDVIFQIKNCTPNPNQRVLVLGNIPALGSWQANQGFVLSYEGDLPEPTWTGTIRVPSGTSLQYKYVLWDGSRIVWEAGRHTPSGNHEEMLADAPSVTFADGNFQPGIVVNP